MAGLGWIHFSDTTRRQVLKIIDILGEPGTIDELGIGVVRNAFSNELFKGISTIMTRARYYYFVPYLMIDYLREKQKQPIDVYMKNAEMDLLEAMTRKYADPEKERIIGYTIAKKNIEVGKRVQELVRKPSEIYWGGIRQFKLFKMEHSFGQLCDSINKGNFSKKPKDNNGNSEESGDDDTKYEKWADLFDVPYRSNWNKHDMTLTPEEALHLQDHICKRVNGQFLSQILKNKDFTKEFLAITSFKEILNTEFYLNLAVHDQQVVKTAVQFWDLLEGAHIRFNLLIQSRPAQEKPISFEQNWDEWVERVMNSFDWAEFDRDFLWKLVDKHSRINFKTKDFINKWLDAIKAKNSIEVLDEIVSLQEKNNKGARSKLIESNKDSYSGWIGIDRLEYRLNNVQIIVRDIASPLDSIGYA
jgi:hypothetical protein